MYTAQVLDYAQPPNYVEVSDLPAPDKDHEEIRLRVLASGTHRVVISKATGTHYSSGPPPHYPGIDGIGEITSDFDQQNAGQKVYFMSFYTCGAMAEYINVPKRNTVALPEGLDPVQAAGMVNPGLSSWMAMKERCQPLPEDATVLILGATSASGSLAVHLARSLGAKRIIGAARSESGMAELDLDEKIIIPKDDVTKTDFSSLGDVDVVLDYIFGPLALHLFNSLKSSKPVQYVHVGGLSGVMEIDIPGAILRSKDLTIRGSGPGSFDAGRAMRKHMPGLLQALVDVKESKVRAVPLKDIEKEWNAPGEGRLVFVP